MPDWIYTLSLGLGSAWLAGINLYATAATLGLLQRFDVVSLPGDMGVLSETWVIGLAVALYLVEFVADKIPAVDSAWDAVHTFIRVPAGAVLAATAFTSVDSQWVTMAALITGGGLALSSHGAKSAVRAAANMSPEPFSNIALSLTEDVFTVGSSFLMVFLPIVMLVVVAVGVVFGIWLARRLWRFVKGRRPPAGPPPTDPVPRTSPPMGA